MSTVSHFPFISHFLLPISHLLPTFPFPLFNKTLLHSLPVCAILFSQHSAVFLFDCDSCPSGAFITILFHYLFYRFGVSPQLPFISIYYSHLFIIHITKGGKSMNTSETQNHSVSGNAFATDTFDFRQACGPVPYCLTNDYLFRAVLQQSNAALKGLICADPLTGFPTGRITLTSSR